MLGYWMYSNKLCFPKENKYFSAKPWMTQSNREEEEESEDDRNRGTNKQI